MCWDLWKKKLKNKNIHTPDISIHSQVRASSPAQCKAQGAIFAQGFMNIHGHYEWKVYKNMVLKIGWSLIRVVFHQGSTVLLLLLQISGFHCSDTITSDVRVPLFCYDYLRYQVPFFCYCYLRYWGSAGLLLLSQISGFHCSVTVTSDIRVLLFCYLKYQGSTGLLLLPQISGFHWSVTVTLSLIHI